LGKIPKARKSRYATSNWNQFKVLFSRKLKLTINDKQSLIPMFAVPIFQSIMLGIMFQGYGKKSPDEHMRILSVVNSMLTFAAFGGGIKFIANRGLMKLENEDAL